MADFDLISCTRLGQSITLAYMAEERLEEIREGRMAKRQAMLDAGRVPYPAEARRTHTTSEAQEAFDQLQADSVPITLAGRVMAVRRHGRIAFLDLVDMTGKMQLQVAAGEVPREIFERLQYLDIGDFIQAVGLVNVTERGAKTLMVSEFHLLTKSLLPLPTTWFGLKDQEKRFRQREVDLLLNSDVREVLLLRGRVLSWLRNYFTEQGYVEVETPVLQTMAGGAAARPFSTHHNALDLPLYMRIAAELHLKRLLVGGFEKVFEIERRFLKWSKTGKPCVRFFTTPNLCCACFTGHLNW